MTAHAPPGRPSRRTAGRSAATRLPWWAVALPALAFVVLLSLTAGGGDAEAAEPSAHLLRLLEHFWRLLTG
ncbi:hypothetical protein CUT44_06405 [Streptomyces carminius]|uniref:Uncharacterized protein n=1 Tax=Streptomyces carminius TaxID=2665496 RepID=A0A2M8M2C2_9ACTN|nr:hypothetical protein [Streptomyces carminius]PJE98348.1 hypothetical protein CUT44_06405 [Streptomyces carminius]